MSSAALAVPAVPEREGRSASLRFVRNGARTVVSEAFAESPLRILLPRNHGEGAWAFLSSLGGGLVDGDAVSLAIGVDEDALAFVATQGPGRVYRSPRGCRQTLLAHVGEGALLVHHPDPLTCFASARFHQDVAFELASTASLLHVDVITAGRTANGERWVAEELRSALRVRREETVLLEEELFLSSRNGNVAARMGRFEALATVVLAGPALAPMQARILANVESRRVRQNEELLQSASRVKNDFVIFRAAATSVEKLVAHLRTALGEVSALLGDDPFSRR